MTNTELVWAYSHDFCLNPTPKIRVRKYGKQYTEQLTVSERKILTEMKDKYNKSSEQEKEYDSFFDFSTEEVGIMKAFAFTEYNSVPLSSSMHQEMLDILEGQELEDYYIQYLRLWENSRNIEMMGFLWGSLDGVLALASNKDFEFKYFKYLLEHPLVANLTKTKLIGFAMDSLQRGKDKFFPEEEITYLLDLIKTLPTIDEHRDIIEITSLIPSIKHIYGLEAFPDDWVEEMYTPIFGRVSD